MSNLHPYITTHYREHDAVIPVHHTVGMEFELRQGWDRPAYAL